MSSPLSHPVSTVCSKVRFPVPLPHVDPCFPRVGEYTNKACPSPSILPMLPVLNARDCLAAFAFPDQNTTASAEEFRPRSSFILGDGDPGKVGRPQCLRLSPSRSISYLRSACPSVAPVSNRCLPSGNQSTLFKLVISPTGKTSAFSGADRVSATCGGLVRSGAATVVPFR